MNFRRWVVFSFLTHVGVVLLDKGAGFVLYLMLLEQPYVKGAADLLTTLPFIMMAVANCGLATSIVYFVRRRRFDLREASETASAVAIYWGTIVAVAGVLVGTLLLPALNPRWEMDLAILVPICATVPLLLTTSYFNSIQLAEERIRDYNLVHLLASASFLPLFLSCYWVSGGVGEGIAWGRLLGATLVASATLWMLRRVVVLRPRWHGRFLREALRYGWKANVTSVLTYLNHRLDLYLVGALFLLGARGLTAEALERRQFDEVAFYSWAVTFAELVWHFPEATRDLFFSKVAGVTQQHARTITPILCRLSLWIAAAAGVAVWLLIDPVLTVVDALRGTTAWQTTWSATVMPALLVLVPGTVGFTVAKVLQADMAARNHLNHCVAATVLTFVTMIGLDVLWIPEHGAVGAACASTVAYLASSGYTLLAYRATGGAGVLACLVPRPSDLGYLRDMARAVVDKLRRR